MKGGADVIGPGTTLAGRYRLLSRLGAGGHGEVWRAQDTLLDRVIAVKTVRSALSGDPEFAARFHAEARSMATIDHPGVVAVFDYGIDEMPGRRTPYLVMQYLDGEPLHLLLSRGGRVPAGATMDLVAQAAEALQAAHEAAVVHRDVKPGNLVIRSDGTVVLTDFGIARTAGGNRLTATGIVLGTATYCAPEQAEGVPPTPAMDVYALGVVAYECLAGRAPFDGESAVAIALKHMHEMPPPLPEDVPAAVVEIVMRALAKDPADRWPSAAALALAARALVDGLDAGAFLAGSQVVPRGVPNGSSAASTSAKLTEGGSKSAGEETASATGGTVPSAGGGRAGGRVAIGSGSGSGAGASSPPAGGPVRDSGSGEKSALRARRRALTVGGGLVAVAVVAAMSWSLVPDDPTRSSASQSRNGVAEPSAVADASLDPLTNRKDSDPSDSPATPDTSTHPEASRRPEASPDPETSSDASDRASAAGLLVGGIILLGGPSPGLPAADGYQPGLVEVFTSKGRRVAERRSDKRGFRFSLPSGGYRLRVSLGDEKCSTSAVVKPSATTRADLKCPIPQPPPQPAFQSAAIQDRAGDAKGGPNAGKPFPYTDLLGVAMKGGQSGVTIEFATAGAIPAAAPSEGNSRSRWAVAVEQGGKTAFLSLTGLKGTWTVQWAAKNVKTGLADETDQVSAVAKPVISKGRISVALGQHASLKTTPIDFKKPYTIVSAESNVVHVFHGWTDSAPS
ncbi:serine/threonine-protein kinase [Nonomuraea fuscirosea]|uniref:serine/threonine-protein kinase n=1 Tax=Nonomuraea fuscirosea TaxID=1291556 RepID=UPI00340BEAFF